MIKPVNSSHESVEQVIFVLYDKDGYGNYVDIYNAELDKTERIAEGDKYMLRLVML